MSIDQKALEAFKTFASGIAPLSMKHQMDVSDWFCRGTNRQNLEIAREVFDEEYDRSIDAGYDEHESILNALPRTLEIALPEWCTAYENINASDPRQVEFLRRVFCE